MPTIPRVTAPPGRGLVQLGGALQQLGGVVGGLAAQKQAQRRVLEEAAQRQQEIEAGYQVDLAESRVLAEITKFDEELKTEPNDRLYGRMWQEREAQLLESTGSIVSLPEAQQEWTVRRQQLFLQQRAAVFAMAQQRQVERIEHGYNTMLRQRVEAGEPELVSQLVDSMVDLGVATAKEGEGLKDDLLPAARYTRAREHLESLSPEMALAELERSDFNEEWEVDNQTVDDLRKTQQNRLDRRQLAIRRQEEELHNQQLQQFMERLERGEVTAHELNTDAADYSMLQRDEVFMQRWVPALLQQEKAAREEASTTDDAETEARAVLLWNDPAVNNDAMGAWLLEHTNEGLTPEYVRQRMEQLRRRDPAGFHQDALALVRDTYEALIRARVQAGVPANNTEILDLRVDMAAALRQLEGDLKSGVLPDDAAAIARARSIMRRTVGFKILGMRFGEVSEEDLRREETELIGELRAQSGGAEQTQAAQTPVSSALADFYSGIAHTSQGTDKDGNPIRRLPGDIVERLRAGTVERWNPEIGEWVPR